MRLFLCLFAFFVSVNTYPKRCDPFDTLVNDPSLGCIAKGCMNFPAGSKSDPECLKTGSHGQSGTAKCGPGRTAVLIPLTSNVLHGSKCFDDFCPPQAACVQGEKVAHCCRVTSASKGNKASRKSLIPPP